MGIYALATAPNNPHNQNVATAVQVEFPDCDGKHGFRRPLSSVSCALADEAMRQLLKCFLESHKYLVAQAVQQQVGPHELPEEHCSLQ